jgi:hypothetical protein
MIEERTNEIDLAFGFSYVSHKLHVSSTALRLYRAARNRGLMRRMQSALSRRSHRLLDLGAVQAACDVWNRHYAGIQTIPIRQIRGSEGRCEDFDADFRPLRTHSKDRWLGIAVAQQMGRTMPPVQLIRIGDVYFVRDGHHRISVARALGQEEIEAEVTFWEASSVPPWRHQAVPDTAAKQPRHQRVYTHKKACTSCGA